MNYSTQREWLITLSQKIAIDGKEACPNLTEDQVDSILVWLDTYSLPGFAADRIRHAIAPQWVRGGTSLREAQRDMIGRLDEGTVCPCCNRTVKRYKRRLNGGMVRSLAWLVIASNRGLRDADGYIDIPNNAPRWLVRARQYPKLTLWGFAERRRAGTSDGPRSTGMWRPTDAGIRFAASQTSAPQYVYEYQSEVSAISPERVRFHDVLDVGFDWDELMSWDPDSERIAGGSPTM